MARRARVDRSPGRGLHGVAVRRVGDQPRGVLRDGLGPLRAKARVEKELFEKLGYAEDATRGVLVLEARALPTDEVAAWVAGKAGVAPAALTFAVAPTASLAGGVQIVARVIETGLHKMDAIGFDVTRVVSAMGTAPLPPTARSDTRRSAARTTAFSTAGRPATPCGRRTTSSPSSPRGFRRPRPPITDALLRHLQALRQRLL